MASAFDGQQGLSHRRFDNVSNFPGTAPGCLTDVAVPRTLRSLLSVSPPIPGGRIPGVFQVNFWRSTARQPLGIRLARNRHGLTIIAEDYSHYGLRKGDEVMSVGSNTMVARDVGLCALEMERTLNTELVVFHNENSVLPQDNACCAFVMHVPASSACGGFMHPPQPRFGPSSFPMRDLLLTSGPTHYGDGLFAVSVVRRSKKVSFGVHLCEAGCEDREQEALPAILEETSGRPYPLKLSSASSIGDEATFCESASDRSSSRSAMDPDYELSPSMSAGEVFVRDVTYKEGQPLVAVTSNYDAGTEPDSPASPLESVTPEQFLHAVRIIVREDLPQYGIRSGDELVAMDGVQPTGLASCQSMMRNALSVQLEFRRGGSWLLDNMTDSVQMMEEEEETWEGPPMQPLAPWTLGRVLQSYPCCGFLKAWAQ